MPELTLQNILIYLAVINILTFIAYWRDKRSAQFGGWRRSEASLLLLTFLGGTPAAIIARKKFRHKTKKGSFRSKFFFIVFLQVVVFIFIALQYLGIGV